MKHLLIILLLFILTESIAQTPLSGRRRALLNNKCNFPVALQPNNLNIPALTLDTIFVSIPGVDSIYWYVSIDGGENFTGPAGDGFGGIRTDTFLVVSPPVWDSEATWDEWPYYNYPIWNIYKCIGIHNNCKIGTNSATVTCSDCD